MITEKKIKRIPKTVIGWQEWCVLPGLGLPAVKAKVDTGAKTSALHAYDIVPFKRHGVDFVRFKVHPIQRNERLEVSCEAPVKGWRTITSSNGEKEKRYVIQTTLDMGGVVIVTEVTLTSRHRMSFRMLLGRDALRQARFTVDPSRSHALGRIRLASKLYKHHSKTKKKGSIA